jgi:hypothetical protein
MIRRALAFFALSSCTAVAGCGSSDASSNPDPGIDSAVPSDSTVIDADTSAACSPATCIGSGKSCRSGACVDDCRPASANACATGTACDFTDGACKDPKSPCFLAGAFEACGTKQCGPGSSCGDDVCVPSTTACSGIDCDETGRCWGKSCVCDRPAATCKPAPLDRMNQGDFVGSLVNMRDEEGAFDLDFDEICNAYAVTMISGPDYLRQLAPDGTFTEWASTTNLNMGQVAVLRALASEFKVIGDIAATYICCASCGCIETGADGRLGVVHLDRTSSTRPLPNVLPAKPTTGTGPFGNATLDTGPYGLTWAGDKNLYVGNVETNGDYVRIDLTTTPPTSTKLVTFAARVIAATPYDRLRLLVATEGGKVFLMKTKEGTSAEFATLPADATSIKRDRFTGRVYAEIRTTPPQILELSADGKTQTLFQKPPRLGRIAIAPDGWLYHLSVFPASGWKTTKDTIVRWELPSKR